jgi:uncharacterized membrane protein
MPKFYEHANRSIAKAITFRVIILFSDGLIVYTITRSYDLTVGVILFSNLVSTVLYYFHERWWNQVHWGKHHKKT